MGEEIADCVDIVHVHVHGFEQLLFEGRYRPTMAGHRSLRKPPPLAASARG